LRLFTKILLLVALNVALITGVGLALLVARNPGGLQGILLAPAQERISSLGRLIALEFSDASPQGRSAILSRYGEQYGLRIAIFENEGRQLGGDPIPLPPEVRGKLRGRPPPLNGMPPPPPKKRGGEGLVFYERGGQPPMDWVAVRTPIKDDAGGLPLRATLFFITPSLFTSSLFLDFRQLLLAVFVAMTITALCWWPFLRSLTREIRSLTAATRAMAEGKFSRLAPSTRKDEVGELTTTVGILGAKLQDFVQGQKRFLGNIAHELSAPLARTQWALGILERDVEPHQREALSDLAEEVDHMARLVNDLLVFFKAGMQQRARTLRAVTLAPVLQGAAKREAGQRCVVRVDENLQVLGDEEYLDWSVANLIRNALRYGGDGTISVTAERSGDSILIAVEDEGPGLPPEELERVFAPFYRPDTARTRSTGGTGLGLAIVKSCIESCGGTVSCRKRKPRGLRVELKLQPI
jgi:two-component system sensor histidine kinase CpxA